MEEEDSTNGPQQPLDEKSIFRDLTQDFISRSQPAAEQDANFKQLVRSANPRLEDGKSLPESWRKHFKPEIMACKPLEEIDPAYGNKTFVVVGKGGTIHRMPTSDSLFLLNPLNPLRKAAIHLNTHYMFSAFIVAVVLLNVYNLVYERYLFDYACVIIYFLELNLKVLSRGLIWEPFTCLRDPWTWLDILTILTSLGRPWTMGLCFFLQWLRLLKIIPLIKVMRTAFTTILISIRRLLPAMFLGGLFLSFLATLGLNFYMGIMTQRCIKHAEYVAEDEWTWEERTKQFTAHNSNSSNWIPDLMCGNATNAGMCPNGTTCHQGFGPNPDYGYTNFDTFIMAFLQAWRVVSQDYLESLMEKIMQTAGFNHFLYFPFAYLIGTFLVGAFAIGLVAQYLDSIYQQGEGYSSAKKIEDNQTLPVTQTVVSVDDNPSWIKGTLKKISEHFAFEVLITFIIFLDIFCFFWNMSAGEKFFAILTSYNTVVVLVLYTAEFMIRVGGQGIDTYFKERWNIFDFTLVILIAVSVFANSRGLRQFGFLVSCIRLFKITPRWAGLKRMLQITLDSFKQFCGFFGIAVTFWILLALMEVFGLFYKQNAHLFENGQPRWHFQDFTHSFLLVFRSWAKETVETLWDCMLVAGGTTCPIYFGIVQLLGILFVTIITISIAWLTMKTVETQNGNQPISTLTKLWDAIVLHPMGLVKEKLGSAKGHDQIKVLQRKESEDPPEGDIDDEEKTDPSTTKRAGNLGKIQSCLESRPILITSIVLISVSSILLKFEQRSDIHDETNQTAIFYADIVFTIYFLCIIILSVVGSGFRSSLSSTVWIFDLVIVLETILHLSLDLYKDNGGFAYAVLVFIRCLRPMMLVLRIERLKVVLLGIWEILKTGFTYIASVTYVWFFFAVIMNSLYSYSLTWCADTSSELRADHPNSSKYTHDWESCRENNHSWTGKPSHSFDDGPGSLVTTFLLPTRNGWIDVMHNVFDATSVGDRHKFENNLDSAFTLFIPFYVFGVLIAASIMIGVVASRLKKSPELFFTIETYKRYFELRTKNDSDLSGEDRSTIPRPESPCRGKVFDFVSSKVFNGYVMFVMIFSFILLSVEIYEWTFNRTWDIIIDASWFIFFLLLLVEVTLKIIGLGKHFFSSGWNWLDLLILPLLLLSFMLSDLIEKYFVSPLILILIRVLRIVTIPLFLSTFPTINTLFRTISLIKPALWNIAMFHLILIWCYAVFWGAIFGHIEHSFRPFASPFISMYLLSAFQGVSDIYLMLANEEDCDRDMFSGPGGCGHWGIATFFVFSYVFLSVLITINFYVVFILELVSQLNFQQAEERSKINKLGDVELRNVPDGENENLQPVAV